MGLNPGRKRRKLVDMTEYPVDPPYEAEEDIHVIFDTPIDLSDGVILHCYQSGKWGQIQDFSLNQYVTSEYPGNKSPENCDVARIDCAHSEIHRHQFYRSGREGTREVIQPLKGGRHHQNSVDLINSQYDDCQDEMISTWEAYLERWED